LGQIGIGLLSLDPSDALHIPAAQQILPLSVEAKKSHPAGYSSSYATIQSGQGLNDHNIETIEDA
jgi:hypothetical protein